MNNEQQETLNEILANLKLIADNKDKCGSISVDSNQYVKDITFLLSMLDERKRCSYDSITGHNQLPSG